MHGISRPDEEKDVVVSDQRVTDLIYLLKPLQSTNF